MSCFHLTATRMSKPKLTDEDFCRASKTLRCEVAAIRAVDDTESKGAGFYSDGFPTILFERHKFRKYTGGKYNESHPQISGPAGNYGSPGQNQKNKFQLAFKLDPDAAMMSCSWGRYQIMGFNYEACGFKSVGDFVDAMKESEGRQLDAFVNFVIHEHLADELRSHDWAGFAEGYNGEGYKVNKYDTKMAAAYKRFAKDDIDCSQISAAATHPTVPATSEQGETSSAVQSPPPSNTVNVSGDGKAINEAQPANLSPDLQVIYKEKASAWSKVWAGICAVFSFFWATITGWYTTDFAKPLIDKARDNAASNVSLDMIPQIAVLIGAVVAIGIVAIGFLWLGVWVWNHEKNRVNSLNEKKADIAADRSRATVEFTTKPAETTASMQAVQK